MYFTLTFDILVKSPNEISLVKEVVKNSLQGQHWVKPLSTHYIVKCSDDRIRKKTLATLVEYCKANPNKLRFVLTPLIDSGQVTGVAAKEVWPYIKKITQLDINDIQF